MKKLIIAASLLFCSCLTPVYAGWEDQILQHKLQMQQQTFNLIIAQFQAYKNNSIPSMAADQIKRIPINDSHESLVSLKTHNNNQRITMMDDPRDPFDSPDHNAGFDESAKVRITVYRSLEQLLQNLDNLAVAFGYAPGQISIRIFEALRYMSTQQTLFENKLQEIQKKYPKYSEAEAYAETIKWVSPVKNNIPPHATGAAVDIRLFDRTKNKYLDMGPFGVIWGDNPTAPTFSAALSEEQINNRLFLLAAATEAGFVNYPYEYWHYSFGDRYAAYWLKLSPMVAIFGQVE
jgi:D-alanyl-D-alanine dipeptidase